ncbi:MAG: hypothetical protein OES32_17865 [Acidobacteriota bacterium]|nr:hypothetical protein [Acidobacteriota bacterium]
MSLGREPGFWERAATNRARLLAGKLRARLAHGLIAQSCIDRRGPLITREADFPHFEDHAGLELV